MTESKRFWISITLGLVGALAIIVTTFVLNGSEWEDAWLYLTGVWLIIYGFWEAYAQRKVKKQ